MSLRAALHTKIKTGSIKTVYNREDGILNPTAPYIVIWKESPLANAALESGLDRWRLACHVVQGAIDTLDAYIETEVQTLLNGVELVNTVTSERYDMYTTREITPAVTNDDETISRDVLLISPLR